jgi:hypothetical protein
MKWLGKSNGEKIVWGEYNSAHIRKHLKENTGMTYELKPRLPESKKQRAFYHGAIIPMIAYYQEGLDHHNHSHLETVHDWLKIELNGEIVPIDGKSHRVAQTTKGRLNNGFLEEVTAWMDEQGYPTELLDPEKYKYWNEVLMVNGDVKDNYIDYLESLGKLTRK